ncbi:putative transporter [Colletotrichum sidae]|uniref:Putative transporter n=1 Tax=Colletotrichum sidae TaxID=1347389 RepID=A0A4R8T8F0_9PEZI|nr:putative transporter [Colletotrichum sidae]
MSTDVASPPEAPVIEKKSPVVSDNDQSDTKSEVIGESDLVEIEQRYTKEELHKLKRKVDKYLLPLMWLCYGIQQTDKTALGTQAIFGLRKDTGLKGQEYSWLTTIFYIAYMCFEFPSNVVLQRYRMGRMLSCYMVCWGIIVLCIGFAQNFTHLMILRGLQGAFECCISPGFILLVGTWYKTREHASRSLVFQSANAGFGVIANLIMYAIGAATQNQEGQQPWRYISYFLGGLTTLVGILCLFLLGTPSEVLWLTKEEKKMASARIVANNTGHDRTGVKGWKWKQVRECLVDPCFWFAGLNAFLSSVPNGGLTTFGSIVITSFGFTNLQTILIEIPRSVMSVIIFIGVGLTCSKFPNKRTWFMAFSVLPPFAGFLGMSLLENTPANKWTKWGCYFITVPFVLALFLAWTLIPSNTAGRTKRTITSSFTFVGYCVGNMVGSQIFKEKDAPKYTPGTIGCAVCFGLEFALILTWRWVLVQRNKKRDVTMANDGLTEDERAKRGKELGEADYTDFENPYFRYTL